MAWRADISAVLCRAQLNKISFCQGISVQPGLDWSVLGSIGIKIVGQDTISNFQISNRDWSILRKQVSGLREAHVIVEIKFKM